MKDTEHENDTWMLWPAVSFFPRTCEKIVLFLNISAEAFSRAPWRRCLTPEERSSAARRENVSIRNV